MLWIRWAFIEANVVLSLLCLHWNSRNPLTTFGKIAGVAIWMWQLVACLSEFVTADASSWV
jgi:hypothetical protein